MVVSEAIKLEYKMKKGEELKYKTIIDSHQEISEGSEKHKVESTVEMDMVQKCMDLNTDGSMVVDVVILGGNVKREGQQEALPQSGQTIQVTMKKSGEIVKTSMDAPFTQPSFPVKTMKIGDTWSSPSVINIPLFNDEGKPSGQKQVTLTYNYTIGGVKKVNGYDCSEIIVKCPDTTVPLQEGVEQKIVASGTTYFAHKQGRLIKSEVSTETVVTAGEVKAITKIQVVVELAESASGGGGVATGGEFNIA